MVVLCPNCGREIFSDPDYCVLCGWKRESEPQRGDGRGRSTGYRDAGYAPPPATRSRNEDYQTRDRGAQRGYPRRQTPSRGYQRRPPPQSRPTNRERYEGGYPERYREGPAERQDFSPQQRRKGPYYDDGRRSPYPDRGMPRRGGESPEYDSRGRRPPAREPMGAGTGRGGRHYCPNCDSELFTDPDSCVLCGWSRDKDEGRGDYGPEDRGSPYPNAPPPRHRDDSYPDDRPPRYQERRYEDAREQDEGRKSARRAPPEDWERRIDEKRDVSRPKPKEDKRFWYRSKTEAPEKDRFVCENCGNPSLQFFADGLGRCPGCGQRFRYSSRPVSPRSKQKHKQFVCSKCDGKNLQFFLDGSGICPHCKREFKWKR